MEEKEIEQEFKQIWEAIGNIRDDITNITEVLKRK